MRGRPGRTRDLTSPAGPAARWKRTMPAGARLSTHLPGSTRSHRDSAHPRPEARAAEARTTCVGARMTQRLSAMPRTLRCNSQRLPCPKGISTIVAFLHGANAHKAPAPSRSESSTPHDNHDDKKTPWSNAEGEHAPHPPWGPRAAKECFPGK